MPDTARLRWEAREKGELFIGTLHGYKRLAAVVAELVKLHAMRQHETARRLAGLVHVRVNLDPAALLHPAPLAA
jgi:hypothetical protein